MGWPKDQDETSKSCNKQPTTTTATLRAFRPPKRNNLKRVADSGVANAVNPQKRQRTRAYIPKYKSANALPRTWTIRQFRTFQRLRTAGTTCPTCTQILPKPTPELVALALHGSRGTSPSESPSTSTGATKSSGGGTHFTGSRTKVASTQTSGPGQGFLSLRPSEYALHQGSTATLSRSSTDVIFTSHHNHLPLTQEATATSSLGYYVARRVAKGLVPHPSLPYNMSDQTLYVEMPRSTCVPNEPAYITYMTSATQINMMRTSTSNLPQHPNRASGTTANCHTSSGSASTRSGTVIEYTRLQIFSSTHQPRILHTHSFSLANNTSP